MILYRWDVVKGDCRRHDGPHKGFRCNGARGEYTAIKGGICMTTRAQMRGYPVEWDGSAWRHSDDGSLAPASGGEERPCVKCGLIAQGDYGPDPCLGWIEGSTGACCGHGTSKKTEAPGE